MLKTKNNFYPVILIFRGDLFCHPNLARRKRYIACDELFHARKTHHYKKPRLFLFAFGTASEQ